LAALADAGQADEYMAVARRCADRFDKAIFSIRLADALERDGKLVEAMRVIERLRVREPNDVTAQLAEATLLLKLGEPAVLQRVYTLLDDVTRAEPDADVRTDCELLRACAQFVRGNAVLGRTMLDDLVRSAPAHPRVKAVATALGD
jgi:predicted Zn-dependent protease